MHLPECRFVLLEIPAPGVLLVMMNLPHQMNALPTDACFEMDRVWTWFDDEEELRVGIITGAGKSFSAGMDLKERPKQTPFRYPFPATGFAGMTRRKGKKPIIAAVNGFAHGGGFEIALNSDLVLASPNATFRLPDVLRGTAALEGAFPRILRTFGLQRAMLLALTGYVLGAEEAMKWGLVIKIVDQEELVSEAITLAKCIADCSPDSVIVSRAGVREAWERGVHDATKVTYDRFAEMLMNGDNVLEGLRAFREKRQPKWVPSKL